MEHQLKEKLQKIIEDNFSKSEIDECSEVLINLVKEKEQLSSENEDLKLQILAKSNSITSKENFISELKSRIDNSALKVKEGEEYKRLYDEMKKTYVDLELKVTKESLKNIYNLAEIAFRSPKKITEFNENVNSTSYDYATGRPTGDYVSSYPVTKVESEE